MHPVLDNDQLQQRHCEEHGDFQAMMIRTKPETWSMCPGCAERKRIEDDHRRDEDWRASRRAGHIDGAIADAGIPRRFSLLRFDDFRAETAPQRKALADVQEYAENFQAKRAKGHGMALLGGLGTGKTMLAATLIQRLCFLGWTARYQTTPGLIRDIRDTWSDRSRSEDEVLAGYITPDLLVLDEVGCRRGTEAEHQHLFDVIDGRYQRCVPTVIAGNSEVDELAQYLGERAVDRIREGGIIVAFTWPSLRGRKAK